jgi:hypothetical protein
VRDVSYIYYSFCLSAWMLWLDTCKEFPLLGLAFGMKNVLIDIFPHESFFPFFFPSSRLYLL